MGIISNALLVILVALGMVIILGMAIAPFLLGGQWDAVCDGEPYHEPN